MSLVEYFENTEGLGILSTADSEGNVDLAVYGRPHIIDEANIAFIMRDRLSHSNIESNPKAAYLFMEKGEGYKGKRLYLTRTRQETDPAVIESFRRRKKGHGASPGEQRFLVYFSVDRERPLIGD